MTKRLTLFITVIYMAGCGLKKTEDRNKLVADIAHYDTSILAILPFDSNFHWVFKSGRATELTTDDLLRIEKILKTCISKYNLEQEKRFKEVNDEHPEYKLDKMDFVLDLRRYKRQYLATINSKGEKEVWVNCFCGEWDENSRKSLLIVMDGGNCYFNLKINLATGLYCEFMVNGHA